jgi:hypothetical protein
LHRTLRKKKDLGQRFKRWPTPAKDVYIGPFAKKCREYAEKFHSSAWCILSAKHGFLFPDDKIPGPYNVSFNDKNTKPINIKKLLIKVRKKNLINMKKSLHWGKKFPPYCQSNFSFEICDKPS